jgi:hypothetical protein
MATVLDRPTIESLGNEPSARRSGADRLTSIGFVQWLMAALLVGAGAVHFAMAPSHFGESTAEGVGFLVSAWLQILLAVAVILRPTRRVAIAIIVASAACIAAWVVSRTAGLPFGPQAGHAESVTVVDGVTVAMEAATLVLAAMLLSRALLRFRSNGMALVAIVGVLALTSALIAAPEARDHAAAAHGVHDHGTAAPSAAVAAAHVHGSTGSTDLNGHPIKGVKAQDVAAETQPDVPLDAATRAALQQQLVIARETAMRYPTVASAEAVGYHVVGGFGPGSGAHYIGGFGGFGGSFDPAKPLSLIYDGTSPTSQMVGLMYYGMGNTAPEGFAGPNDHWHRHSNVCTRGSAVLSQPDADITPAACAALGGSFMKITGWMVHAWVVPAWESPDGVFSHENPNLRCADGTFHTDKIGACQGT